MQPRPCTQRRCYATTHQNKDGVGKRNKKQHYCERYFEFFSCKSKSNVVCCHYVQERRNSQHHLFTKVISNWLVLKQSSDGSNEVIRFLSLSDSN